MTHDKWKKYRDELDKAGELDEISGMISLFLMKKGYIVSGEDKSENDGLIAYFKTPKGQRMSITVDVIQ